MQTPQVILFLQNLENNDPASFNTSLVEKHLKLFELAETGARDLETLEAHPWEFTPADYLQLARYLGRLKKNGFYDKSKQIPKISDFVFNGPALERMLEKNKNQNIPTEMFAIGIQMGMSDLGTLYKHIDQNLLSNQILNFEKNVQLIKNCYQGLISGGIGKVGLTQEQVLGLIEKLKTQVDVFGEKNSFLLVHELKPNNVKSFLDVMSVVDAGIQEKFLKVFENALESDLQSDEFQVSDWKEILDRFESLPALQK